MTPETLKALEGSIAKWKRIIAGRGADHGGRNCPLCKLFNNSDDHDEPFAYKPACTGCPVMAKTRMRFCQGTPYVDWMEWDSGDGRVYTSEQRHAAERELEFLQSLLPEKST